MMLAKSIRQLMPVATVLAALVKPGEALAADDVPTIPVAPQVQAMVDSCKDQSELAEEPLVECLREGTENLMVKMPAAQVKALAPTFAQCHDTFGKTNPTNEEACKLNALYVAYDPNATAKASAPAFTAVPDADIKAKLVDAAQKRDLDGMHKGARFIGQMCFDINKGQGAASDACVRGVETNLAGLADKLLPHTPAGELKRKELKQAFDNSAGSVGPGNNPATAGERVFRSISEFGRIMFGKN